MLEIGISRGLIKGEQMHTDSIEQEMDFISSLWILVASNWRIICPRGLDIGL